MVAFRISRPSYRAQNFNTLAIPRHVVGIYIKLMLDLFVHFHGQHLARKLNSMCMTLVESDIRQYFVKCI